ncbi:zinc finger protein 224-like isoform X2 [Acanthochromis polyacanthus]|uniref:zinc finger protein 224-like isoform X2 n=1 Tax=Acanthochromis polyacanthus TaxID=80966 RepID=UPI002233E45A|nr:zinc finger protein 224-like isoform X2 [Acanthochromis polyacanthus]
MGEVTVKLEEVVMKQEASLDPLPEPLLIILSPPPAFLPVPGEPTMLWPKWLKAFEHYLEALGEKELVDSSKCMLLQNCLGPEGQRIFTILIPNETTYITAISVLTVYFSGDHAIQMHRLKFHQRVQMPGETLDEFVSVLEELLRPCNYGNLKDELLLDHLITKTNYPQLRERLLMGRETLTLATALVIGKEVESAFNKSQIFDIHEVSVDIGDDLDPPVQRKAKRGRPRRTEKRAKTNSQSTKTPTTLPRHKDNYYYRTSKLCSGDTNEGESTSGNTAALDTEGDGDNGASSSSLRIKEDGCNKATDSTDDEDDDDGVLSLTRQKGPYCPICSRCFRYAHKLARHMRTHTKEKPFICPICATTFSQSYHMTRHLRNQHGAGQHVCSTCGESLGSYAELQSHKRTHKSQVLSCPDCNEKFTNSDVFSCHIKSHSENQSSQTEAQSSQQADGSEVKSNDANDDAISGNGNSPEKEINLVTEDKNPIEGKSQVGGRKKEKVTCKTKTKGHFCPICVGKRFRGPNKLARHMRTHTKEKPFTCPVCAMTFSQSYHMTRHARNQHCFSQYICSKCGKSYGSWLELKAHKKTHAIEGLTCLACDKQFKEKAALASHLKLHKEVQSSPRNLICGDCGKVFGRLYHLKRHIVTHRKAGNGECYMCPDCQKTFAFPEDLNKHLEIHVKENNGTCPKCNETFSSPEELEAHMGVHQKSYACSTCGKKFKVEYALKKHEQGHQNEQYYCSLCQKRFLKLSHYKRHIMVHDRRESRCPHCDSVFLQLTALKYHLRTHTEERPYQCTCCIETFEEKEDLEQHCLKHRKFKKQRPYSCTRCDYAFCTLVELTEHMSSHEGEPPLTCPDCGRTFLNKNKLEKHLTIHTGERPHLCSICGNGFPSAASLKLHINIHTVCCFLSGPSEGGECSYITACETTPSDQSSVQTRDQRSLEHQEAVMDFLPVFSLETWILLIMLIYLFIMYGQWTFGVFEKLGVPGPKPIMYMGTITKQNDVYYIGDCENAQKYGRIWGVYEFRKPMLVVADPDMLRTILVKECFTYFTNRRNLRMNGDLYDSVSIAEDNQWRRIRNILTPAFTSGRIKEMYRIMKHHSHKLTDSLQSKAQNEEILTLKDVFGAYSMDVMASCAFGIDMDSNTNPSNPLITNASKLFKVPIFLFFLQGFFPFLLPLYELLGVSIFPKSSTDFFKKLVEKITAEQIGRRPSVYDRQSGNQ